jgi:hypothetical protein
MALEEIEEIKKEFIRELQKDPNLLKQERIDTKELDGIYKSLLKKRHGKRWVNKDIQIFFKDRYLIERIMERFNYNHLINVLDNLDYFQKKLLTQTFINQDNLKKIPAS